MAFAQLTYRDGLRDIETCLRAMQAKLYHAGFRGKIARSTLSDANEVRDWRIYADFAHVLILQILSICLFEKMPIQQALAADLEIFSNNESCNQTQYRWDALFFPRKHKISWGPRRR